MSATDPASTRSAHGAPFEGTVERRERPRVVMLAFDFAEYCVNIAGALSADADVWLLAPDDQLARLERPAVGDVRVIPFRKPRLRQPLAQLGMCRRLLREIRRIDPDVVHMQQGHFWFNFALPLVRAVPLVVTVHDHRPHEGDAGGQKTPVRVMRIAFRRAAALICHAEQVKRELVRDLGIPERRVTVIPHVEIGASPEVAEAPAPSPNSVLFFGRIWPYKGLDHLIAAVPAIARAIPDVKVVIAGEGEPFERYRAMMADPRRFEVHNRFVSDEERDRLFSDAAVVVLPYVEATQSGVVPVAYSFSRPVVATNVGGLPEVVRDGETGYLVPPGDDRALADAIVMLLAEPGRAREMGTAGRTWLTEHASSEAVAASTLKVYGRVMEGARERAV